jgi:hypothetical protein
MLLNAQNNRVIVAGFVWCGRHTYNRPLRDVYCVRLFDSSFGLLNSLLLSLTGGLSLIFENINGG